MYPIPTPSFLTSCIKWKGIPCSLLQEVKPEARITDAIGTLCSYTLFSYTLLTPRGDDDVYDMHRLVDLAIRIWLDREGRITEAKKDAIKHMAKIFPFGGYENRKVWREYLPHALRLMNSDNMSMR
jgi:hypothetical protein